MSDARDVLIAGGGTGGHVFPGLALADALRARGMRVGFVGTPAGLEARAVPAAGYPIDLIPGRQVRGGGIGRAAGGAVALASGVARARRLLMAHRPRLVVGVGGYASVAAVVAAGLGRRPVVLMEQNAIPGMANRTLGRLARRVCLGFAEAASFFPAGRTVHTGNPIRPAVLAAPPSPPHDRLGLLIFGGSQGATHINDAAVVALGALGDGARALRITHQTGIADQAGVASAYAGLGLDVRVEAFITDMGAAYRAADVVVARAGAMSCAEITAMGLPSVLIPYPYAADDHQRRNAEVIAAAGAATVILDRELDGPRLTAALAPLVGDAAARCTMASLSRALGRPDAANTAADVCLRVIADHPLEDHVPLL
ncbi:MAG TPA: undecaprenyldiphospho-muramoylpentapeptide beta-N-acetylglucosaminyltransferase [Candidatus Binatia bacterium]|jgi:UDP-N-acetylglucosamine--N-acetylmuramyl-(pentapeptide) pyrophosphoryl-undecaprenol N-acetylglucosamine transferase|nr:undecaprenyldiphospho-muramoylpentapeptide beta-N-acetylglucosaminyltransferase [Candidatus Binatia bacterium]